MAVVINRMESNVEMDSQPATAPVAAAAPPASEGDLEDFRQRWAALLREIVRDEIERHLRSAAD